MPKIPSLVAGGWSLAGLLGAGVLASAASRGEDSSGLQGSFANFESPQARSIAVSEDGRLLFALNTPANLLTVLSLTDPQAPELVQEIPVGLDPVSLAIRDEDELWIASHVSDSIDVVSLSRGAVVETIRVGDRPGDVVFAGSPRRAFVTSMTGRAVHVLDPEARELLSTIPVFCDDPCSLRASEDGETVWVASRRSGNGTTIAPHAIAPPPPAPTNADLPPPPPQGILVDAEDPTWSSRLGVTLPDHDVVEIDADSLAVRRSYRGVGTILFDLAQRPGTDELWVVNTHSRNLVRFEPELRGHVIDSRVTRILTGQLGEPEPVDLNVGIEYGELPSGEARSIALSQPTDLVFDRDGELAYVAAFGTDRIGVLDADGGVLARIEVGDAPGARVAPRTKRGPRALALHGSGDVLYVLNRLSNSVSVIDTRGRTLVGEIALFDPTPPHIREGRGFLFDAKLSGNGTFSCAACHVDADRDGLAWDLGNPGGELFHNGSGVPLHPMKGPLLTQTLRGLAGERLFHWRADRPGLQTFNATFEDLLGGALLGPEDLRTFVKYLRSIRFSPNPNRSRDDSLATTPPGASAMDGEEIFRTKENVAREGKTRFRCADCHVNASGSGGFGFTGLVAQSMKAVQLRGLHERDGRSPTAEGRSAGFGYGPDGSMDDLASFLSSSHRFEALSADERAALQRFLFAFPTETAPIVGFARTVTAQNARAGAVLADLRLLVARCELGECDLIVRGVLDGRQAGFVYRKTEQHFSRDRAGLAPMELSELTAGVLDQDDAVLTFSGVPSGSGARLGVDRDADGILDGDEGRTAQPTNRRVGEAAQWNQFRGPNGDGKSDAAKLPVQLGEAEGVRWRTRIHGRGWSSPVVWGDQVWLTTGHTEGGAPRKGARAGFSEAPSAGAPGARGSDPKQELFAVCVSLESGDVVHDLKVFDAEEPLGQWWHLNSPASPTPVVEEGRVYVHFGTHGTACLDTVRGRKLWERRDLHCDHVVGPASSPVVEGDLLYLALDGIDSQSIVALHKLTGETVWTQEREVDSDFVAPKEKPNDNRKSYATAQIIEHEGRRQLISPAAEATISYDPETGEELWRVHHHGGWNLACRPIFGHGLVYVSTSGLGSRLLAVRPSGTGDVTDRNIAWSTRRGAPDIPSPLLVGDMLFTINSGGIATCLDAKSGQVFWRERIGGEHYSSPLCAAGKIYFFSREGAVSVIAAGEDYQLLAGGQFDEGFNASPAIAGDAMILRTETRLYCIEADAQRQASRAGSGAGRGRDVRSEMEDGFER